MDLGALDALTLAVDQPDLPESRLAGRLEVGLDDGRDLRRPEGMQVERVLDGDDDRLVALRHAARLPDPSPEDVVSTTAPRW